MYNPLEQTALWRSLEARADLQQRLIDLRTRVDRYLRSSTNLFPHFTSHGVDHSDEIVLQLSKLLEPTGSPAGTSLNHAETYLLIAAAYLHDTGMVVTDSHLQAAVSSPEWASFVGRDATVAADIATIESINPATSDAEQVFLAGLAQRLHLASFFRSQHAKRAEVAINGALSVDTTLCVGEPAAVKALVAICRGHGIERSDLLDEDAYPTQQDLFGEPVNVRLLTILIRVGDLLDMRVDRACSELRAAADPMPTSSAPHWDQYKRITHRTTSPREIRLTAQCETADEHRLLRDWCGWLADEVNESSRILRSTRWPDERPWTPPLVSVDGPAPTIRIERAPGATYKALDWRFELNEAEILTRLISDIQTGRFGWLKELLQNALDANRAMLQLDGHTETYPNTVKKSVRSKRPVTISLGGSAQGLVDEVTVSDCGQGMTAEVIRDYFLQIGRSWYRSEAFADHFTFAPSSRFGIGFLSVFAVSDDVEVTSRWHEAPEHDALRISLRGPRNYLLFEDSRRATSGTDVHVSLSTPVPINELTSFLHNLLVSVEFPVKVVSSVPGSKRRWTITAREPAPPHEIRVSNDLTFREVRIPPGGDGVFGFFSIDVTEDGDGLQDWSLTTREIVETVNDANPLLELPSGPGRFATINGLETERVVGPRNLTFELDFRTASATQKSGLDRASLSTDLSSFAEHVVEELDANVAGHPGDLDYQQRLVKKFADFVPDWAETQACWEALDGSRYDFRSIHAMRHVIMIQPAGTTTIDGGLSEMDLEAFRNAPSLEGRLDRAIQAVPLYAVNWDQSLEERPALSVLTISDQLYAIELGPVPDRPGTRRPSPPRFDSTSTFAVTTGHRTALLNDDHPIMRRLGELGPRARSVIEESIYRSSGFFWDLGEKLKAVATATGDAELLAWSEHAIEVFDQESGRYQVIFEAPAGAS
jgi:molecular chaperone HtpG